ncbi:MAG: hypothetical protein MZV65_02790 [Chromatiales bacterium]|nr:hypothetical protein [Chromatiales bacterium]
MTGEELADDVARVVARVRQDRLGVRARGARAQAAYRRGVPGQWAWWWP